MSGRPKFRPVVALPAGTLRGIAPATAIGIRPCLEWVDPASLYVEQDYQRDLSERSIAMIRRIVAGWHWTKIKPAICVRVGEKLAVIDGQHTAIAAVSHGGIAKIPVAVVEAATLKERAEAFVSQNRDRLALTPMHMHHAAVAAGEELAVAVDQACARACVTILRGAKSCYAVGDTFAIGIIARIVGKIGAHHGAKVLKVLVDAKRAPLVAHEIAAVYQLLYGPDHKGKVDGFDLTTVIRTKSVEAWRAAAWKLISAGTPRRDAIAAVFLKALAKEKRDA